MGTDINKPSAKKLPRKAVTGLIILLAVIPALNNFLLGWLYSYIIKGNFLFANYEIIIQSAIRFLNIISTFSVYAYMIYGVLSRTLSKSWGIFAVCAGSVLIQYAGSYTSAMISSSSQYAVYFLIYIAGSYLIALSMLLLVSLITAAVRKASMKKISGEENTKPQIYKAVSSSVSRAAFAASLIFLAAGTAQQIFETISDISAYGAPQNLSEYVYIISPYIELALYSVAGYFIIQAVSNLFRKDPENTETPESI